MECEQGRICIVKALGVGDILFCLLACCFGPWKGRRFGPVVMTAARSSLVGMVERELENILA
jgi:hypothetical protein